MLKGLGFLQNAPISDLENVDYVINIIQNIGLTYDSWGNYIYGINCMYMLPLINLITYKQYSVGEGGLLQIPRQLAEVLFYS